MMFYEIWKVKPVHKCFEPAFFHWPAGGDFADFKKKSNCMELLNGYGCMENDPGALI